MALNAYPRRPDSKVCAYAESPVGDPGGRAAASDAGRLTYGDRDLWHSPRDIPIRYDPLAGQACHKEICVRVRKA